MKFLKSVANSIHPSIRMTTDYTSRYKEGKCPMLDIRMWIEEIEGRYYILYEHYEKEMSTKAVIHASSAIPRQTKRTVLTQEMLRILLHCSNHLAWQIVLKHLNNFMRKMQYSGYDQTFRYTVAKSAINAYEIIRNNEARGFRPMHRPKTWQRTERIIEKEEKKKTWYKQGGFDTVLFYTKNTGWQLKRLYERVIRRSGIRMKVVERTGRTLKSQLRTSDPFREQSCGREDCFVCLTFGQGNCKTESITYRIDCSGGECEKGIYKGETAHNAYTRGKEHMGRLASRDLSNSPLWRHCLEQHECETQAFLMSVTGTYRNDTMLRQITEAVQIDNMDPNERMNDRSEWNMTRVPRTVLTTNG